MAHIGSWGTPDLGISEWFANRLGIPRNSQGGSEIGIVGTTGLINNGVQDYQPDYNNATTTVNKALAQKAINNTSRNSTSSPQRTTINNVPTNNNPSGGNNNGDAEREANAYAQRVASLQNSLRVLLENIQRQRDFAGQTRDTNLSHLKNTYYGDDDMYSENPTGGLIGANTFKKQSELDSLSKILGNVNTLYKGNKETGEKGYFKTNEENKANVLDQLDQSMAQAQDAGGRALYTNARNLGETNTLNRVLARARGIGGSSQYEDVQNKSRYKAEELGRQVKNDINDKKFQTGAEKVTQGNWYDTKGSELRNEFSGKIDSLGNEKLATERYYNDLDSQYKTDFSTAYNNENTRYQQTISNLMSQEQIYGINNADQLQQEYNNHQTRLGAIRDYANSVNEFKGKVNSAAANAFTRTNNYGAANNVAGDMAKNDAVNSMGSGALTKPYANKISDNTANNNVLNTLLASLKDMGGGLPTEAMSSARMNIKKAQPEEDKYAYLINQLLGHNSYNV